MAAIQRLSEETINQIAAGEVVESPASVVKELIENSVDAGASRIVIEVAGGGFSLIRVADDGCGMDAEDALLSLERHATSKIRVFHDLLAIDTMGFRGEALASIAAVSRLTLLTAGEKGIKIECEAGKIIAQDPFPKNRGTTIEVRSLFYNVPARKKFQKSAAASLGEIHRLVTSLALAYPTVSFELRSHDQLVLQAQSTSLPKRAAEVLGEPFYASAFPVQSTVLHGLLGSPAETRPNRLGQYLFINRRAVTSPAIAFAVKDGYGSRIDSGRFPIFILHLHLPPSAVDVNVHPQKREVRFRDEAEVKAMVRSSVAEALYPRRPETLNLDRAKTTGIDDRKEVNIRNIDLFTIVDSREFSRRSKSTFQADGGISGKKAEIPTKSWAPPVEEKIFVPNFVFREEAVSPPPAPLVEEEPNILGIFKDYLFVIEQGIIVLDLKSAYEHVVYMETSSSPIPQGLLFPVSLDLLRGEGKILEARLPEIEKAGFSVRLIGKDLFAIEAIPSFLHADEAVDAVHALLEGDVPLKLSRFAGQRKSDFVLQEAIALWKKVRPLGLNARSPQGNLIFVAWSMDELQKLFRS